MKEKRADSLPADADELATILENNANSNLEDLVEEGEEPIVIPSEDETSN